MRRRSIKSVLEDPRKDEYYILITRSFPEILRRRGLTIKDSPINAWEKQLAYAFDFFKNGNPPSYLDDLMEFHMKKAGGKKIILVCFEDDGKDCHAKSIIEYFMI